MLPKRKENTAQVAHPEPKTFLFNRTFTGLLNTAQVLPPKMKVGLIKKAGQEGGKFLSRVPLARICFRGLQGLTEALVI